MSIRRDDNDTPAIPALSTALARVRAVLYVHEPRHRGLWRTQSVGEHVDHAIEHLRVWQQCYETEPHLTHAACRLLFALELIGERGEPDDAT